MCACMFSKSTRHYDVFLAAEALATPSTLCNTHMHVYTCEKIACTQNHTVHRYEVFSKDFARLVWPHMYVYIYTYTHIHTHTQTYTYMPVCTDAHIHTRTHAHTYITYRSSRALARLVCPLQISNRIIKSRMLGGGPVIHSCLYYIYIYIHIHEWIYESYHHNQDAGTKACHTFIFFCLHVYICVCIYEPYHY
jgi:hypothetical protein